jgi:energy-coupling factor transporter ATP-binding protein EcfA2
MTLPSERAVDLRSAYRICEVTPLEGEDLRYYVQLASVRKSESMNNISTMLEVQEAGEFSSLLFTGHRGCGKSTELHHLQSHWEKSYRVIYMEVDEQTDINDVAYTDLYLLVVKYVEYSLRSIGLQPDRGIVKDIEDWFCEVTDENVAKVESSVSISGEVTLSATAPFLAKLMVKLLAQIKGASEQKSTIRKVLERDFSRLKANVNLLLDDCLRKLQAHDPHCKGILLIFDNLDRCPPSVANRLFFDYAPQLQELHCSVIYTVPISVLYSPNSISNGFSKRYIVPMLGVYEYERDRDELAYKEDRLKVVANIVDRRVDISKVFKTEADLLNLVRASGGHVRHLMQMMREACLTAIGRGHTQVEADDILYAINQLQFDFERQVPDTHYPAIARAQNTKKISNDEIGQLTLFNTSVLEHNGTHRWNYPHPAVVKTDAFQRARAELNSGTKP